MTYTFALIALGSALLTAGVRDKTLRDTLQGVIGGRRRTFTRDLVDNFVGALGVGAASDVGSAVASATSGVAGAVGGGKVAELIDEGAHIHLASRDRVWLIAQGKRAQKMGLSVREHPAFDPVDCVHVKGSWHYRDSRNPNTERTCQTKGNGLAIDVSGARQDEFHRLYR